MEVNAARIAGCRTRVSKAICAPAGNDPTPSDMGRVRIGPNLGEPAVRSLETAEIINNNQ